MTDVAEHYEHAGVIVEIVQDNDPVNDPQDNDNAGTIYSWTREWDGDETITEPSLLDEEETNRLAELEAAFSEAGGRGVTLAEEIDELRARRDLPSYMRDNYDAVLTIPLRFSDYGSSGARISVSYAPNCAICFTQKELDEEWNGSVDDATKYAEARINELDEWMQGYVFGIVIRDREMTPEEAQEGRYGRHNYEGRSEVLESVWGFIGDLYGESGKYIREEANGMAEAVALQVAHEKAEAAAWAARGVVTV